MLGLCFFCAILCALSSVAIILLKKRELNALLLLCSESHVDVTLVVL